jgi:hypothetical protein
MPSPESPLGPHSKWGPCEISGELGVPFHFIFARFCKKERQSSLVELETTMKIMKRAWELEEGV